MSWGLAISIAVGLGNGAWAQADPAAPVSPEVQPPVVEAQAPTRATFVSTSGQQWQVLVDDQPVCSTPCSGPLFPQQFVVLQSQEWRPVILDVGRLPPGDLLVSAKPLESGMYAGGIVATTLGGMAMAIGITFVSVGLAKDRGGMTTAGLITGAVGLLALPGGIYLMMKAVPNVSVDRAAPNMPDAAMGIAGTF